MVRLLQGFFDLVVSAVMRALLRGPESNQQTEIHSAHLSLHLMPVTLCCTLKKVVGLRIRSVNLLFSCMYQGLRSTVVSLHYGYFALGCYAFTSSVPQCIEAIGERNHSLLLSLKQSEEFSISSMRHILGNFVRAFLDLSVIKLWVVCVLFYHTALIVTCES